jgi:hypothetical protein
VADRFHSAKEIAANGTATISQNGGCLLHAIAVNDPGSGWAVAVFNDVTQTNRIANLKPTALGTVFFDVVCPNGLSVVASGTTPGSITVSFS